MTEPEVTWLRTGAWTCLASGHRWGWYRYLVAYIGSALLGGFGGAVTSVPASIGWVPVVAFGVALLWWLPGPRRRLGLADGELVIWGWFRRTSIPLTEVNLLRLGHISWGQGSVIGAEVVWRGRGRHLPGCPLLSTRARTSWIEPVVEAARAAGIPTMLDAGSEFAFPEVNVDQIGVLSGRAPDWSVKPSKVDPQLGAGFGLVALSGVSVISGVVVVYGVVVEEGGVVSIAGVFFGISLWMIAAIAWPAWWYWHQRNARTG